MEMGVRFGHTIVLENGDKKSGGVGVVLSRRATKAWDSSGRKVWRSECHRLLAVRLLFTDDAGKEVSVVAMSGYRPLRADIPAQERFDAEVVSMLDSFAKEDVVLFGVDVNGAVGIQHGDTVGKYGLARTNPSGLAFRPTSISPTSSIPSTSGAERSKRNEPSSVKLN